jgi:hypothetical protein
MNDSCREFRWSLSSDSIKTSPEPRNIASGIDSSHSNSENDVVSLKMEHENVSLLGTNPILNPLSVPTVVATHSSGWKCQVCLIQNDSNASQCAACETSKPTTIAEPQLSQKPSGFNFEMPIISKGQSQFNFGVLNEPKASSTGWTCDVCLVPNKPSDNKCVACETPNPKVTICSKPPDAETQRAFSVPKSMNIPSDFAFGGFGSSPSLGEGLGFRFGSK